MSGSFLSESILRDGSHVFYTDGHGLLLSYEGPGGEVKVPEGVRRIGDEAFAFCTHVTDVILPEGVQRIEQRAFFRSGIRTVSLPETLTYVGELAFSETSLEHIELPDQVIKLEARVFLGADRLKTVKLPAGITSLDPEVFANCVSLKEITVPESVKYIEGSAFLSCTGLESISLPEGLIAVWTNAFSGCSSLREIYLGDSVEALGNGAFRDCTSLEKVRIPEALQMTHGNAFENARRITLTGPGQALGLIIQSDPDIYYHPGLKKMTVSEGVKELPSSVLREAENVEVLDLPRSLKFYSWDSFTSLHSLRQIVTDRDALAAEIALLLDIESVDRNGQKFTFVTPERDGEWITERDGEHGGLRLLGCTGKIGRTGQAKYTTVIIPDRINGEPMTCIGANAFVSCDFADAFYIPDTVQFIERRAFGFNGFSEDYGGELFIRMPACVHVAPDAFEGTKYFTRESTRKAEQQDMTEDAAEKAAPEATVSGDCAAEAADDPANGAGITGRPNLKSNIWQYFDRLSREERIHELTHCFRIKGNIDGVGWAMVDITLDDESTWFRISYIGNSPADFRVFCEELEDGECGFFGWSSEPGSYRWNIQRRGGVFYVKAPRISKSFFIPRKAFLDAVSGLTDEW